MSYPQSFATEQKGNYYYSDGVRVLETDEPIEGYELKEFTMSIFEMMDEYKFYNLNTDDYKLYPLKHDLSEGIKELSGRRYSELVVYHGSSNYPYVNARYLRDGMKILNSKQIMLTEKEKRCPVFLFHKDNIESRLKMMIFPINTNKDFIGFRNVITGEIYETNIRY